MSFIIYCFISLCITFWAWKKRKRFSLNSDSLQKQWLFRLAIVFPLISSLYFILWLSAPYPFQFDANGYNSFLEINKFSLGILALSPILGAFIVYAHRSIQMAKQIEITEKKNKVDLYFLSRKNINELLSSVKTSADEEIFQSNLLYTKAFDLKSNYEDTENPDFYDYLNESIGSCYNTFLTIRDSIHDVDNFKKSNINSNEVFITVGKEIIRISKSIDIVKEFLNFKVNPNLDLANKCVKFFVDNRDSILVDTGNFYDVRYTMMIAGEIYSFLNTIKEVVLILSPNKNIDLILPNFDDALTACSIGSFSVEIA